MSVLAPIAATPRRRPEALAAGYRRREVAVTGPTRHPVRSAIAIRDRTAVAEPADACVLARLPGDVPAALVVTGEDSLDSRSLHGKAPIGVAEAAHDAGCRWWRWRAGAR